MLGESKILSKADGLLQHLQYKYHGGYGGPNDGRFDAEARAVTASLLKLIRQEVEGVPAYMVNCDGEASGPNAQWEAIAAEAGFVPLPSASNLVESRKWDRTFFNIDGGHLSPEGNAAYGHAFARDMVATGVVRDIARQKSLLGASH